MYVTWVAIASLAVIQFLAGIIVSATGFGSAIIAQVRGWMNTQAGVSKYSVGESVN